MKQVIKLKDIYSADLYTRSKATDLKSIVLGQADEVEMDFSDIAFMSRSFADELYNVTESFPEKQFVYVHRNDVVETMMNKVAEGRKRERTRGFGTPQRYEFNTMESLEEFLMAQ